MDDDPGWPLTTLVTGMVPLASQNQLRKLVDEGNGLLALRLVFCSFCSPLLWCGVVLAVIHDPVDGASAEPGIASVAGAVALIVFGAQWLIRRPLDCSSEAALHSSYRSRFFVSVACSQTPALAGFVCTFLYRWWTYPLGLAVTAIGFVRLAPTASHLRRDQEELAATGCTRSLIRTLQDPPRSEHD